MGSPNRGKTYHRRLGPPVPPEHEEVSAFTPPPKYRSVDVLKSTYGRLGGVLGVPKEPFVSMP